MLPQEFTDRMRQMLGEEYPAFLESYDRPRARALRVNTLKCDRDSFLEKAPFELSQVPWEENGFYYGESDAPGKHPYHFAGVYYIQEPSAMAPAAYLRAKPGERILDLCAAPGGKSTQIAAAMQGEGLLISNEIHPARAKILSENIERMGIRNCIVTNESPAALAERFPAYFDRIMVDAPCSGEGMFKKNDEALSEWSLSNVLLCAKRQLDILSVAATMLRDGGQIVYSTCTFAEEENEGVIGAFLESHPDFSKGETLRLFPHRVRGEGHFLAVLMKEGVSSRISASGSSQAEPVRKKEYSQFYNFCDEFLEKGALPGGEMLSFGDQIYLLPQGAPQLKGLKVLRAGLHLGTMKKNRFEPSHALALALGSADVKLKYDLKSDESLVKSYLSGNTFPAEGAKGWYLITTDGISLGWGKLAGGIMKNHYPKGLRIQL